MVSTELGRLFGVWYTVEGGVRRDGNRLRITAQLVDASTGYELWSERYDRSFEDIFEIQSEIAKAIFHALEIEIHEGELARIQREPTNSLSPFDVYMRGISHFFRYEHGEHLEARRHFERAMALDGGHAMAHAYRAASHLTPSLFGWVGVMGGRGARRRRRDPGSRARTRPPHGAGCVDVGPGPDEPGIRGGTRGPANDGARPGPQRGAPDRGLTEIST